MKLDKAYKNLDAETIAEIEGLTEESLKSRITQANQAMQQVSDELDANDQYQELLESKKAMEEGKKEVNKRQNSVITVCLSVLAGQGK